MRPALFAVVASAVLTGVAGPTAHAEAATPCGAASADRSVNRWLSGTVSRPGEVDYFRFRNAASRWTLIKLGKLSADLQLKVYDSGCRLIATSQHVGTHFEQVYRPLPAGRYYVGVSGVSGAAGAYYVKFSPITDGVHVLSTHAFITAYRKDLLEVDGEVLNNRSTPNFFRYVKVTFFNAAGGVVARAEGTFPESYVRARSRASFWTQLIKPSKPYARYAVTVVTQALNGYPAPPQTRIAASSPWRDPQGNLHYAGKITNTSTRTIWLGSVNATLYNSLGNVLYVDSGPISPSKLSPKKTGTFDVVFQSPGRVNCAALRFG